MTVFSSANAREARELGLIAEEPSRYDLSAMGGNAVFRHDSGEHDATGILQEAFETFGHGWKRIDSEHKSKFFSWLITERIFLGTGPKGRAKYEPMFLLKWVADVDADGLLRNGRLPERLTGATNHCHVLWVSLPPDSAPAAQGWKAAAVHIGVPATFQGDDGRYYVSLRDSIIGHYRMYRSVQEAADHADLVAAAVEYRASLTGHDGVEPEDWAPRESDSVDLRVVEEEQW